eukprot:CAMPEP_0177619202 /NCGR_PEP_ID=MMETSP0419_2-20121207/26112_1 /TAXON_ID=582737 /ORGANISM="Tetraselmis sp., Strain GSL018" /LENGTH=206 /DNA_ID=CAMNT_0019118409 /DNA_START=420 /DNA_END=1037 /DNA_ORIENTATION=+
MPIPPDVLYVQGKNACVFRELVRPRPNRYSSKSQEGEDPTPARIELGASCFVSALLRPVIALEPTPGLQPLRRKLPHAGSPNHLILRNSGKYQGPSTAAQLREVKPNEVTKPAAGGRTKPGDSSCNRARPQDCSGEAASTPSSVAAALGNHPGGGQADLSPKGGGEGGPAAAPPPSEGADAVCAESGGRGPPPRVCLGVGSLRPLD